MRANSQPFLSSGSGQTVCLRWYSKVLSILQFVLKTTKESNSICYFMIQTKKQIKMVYYFTIKTKTNQFGLLFYGQN